MPLIIYQATPFKLGCTPHETMRDDDQMISPIESQRKPADRVPEQSGMNGEKDERRTF
jgi:hypothetical protein